MNKWLPRSVSVFLCSLGLLVGNPLFGELGKPILKETPEGTRRVILNFSLKLDAKIAKEALRCPEAVRTSIETMVDNDLPSAEDDFISVSEKFYQDGKDPDPRGDINSILAHYFDLFNKKNIPLPLDKNIGYDMLIGLIYGFDNVSLSLQDLDISLYLDDLYEIMHPGN
jgi:hypothetical protein